MYSLPTTIKIRDNDFKIRNDGDFRMVLDCFSAIQDIELSEEERVISSLVIFYDDIDSYEDVVNIFGEDIEVAIKEMFNFFNCGQSMTSNTQDIKVIDWEQDSQMICSAINNVAKKEVRAEPYLHWWTFMGYYTSIGESVMSNVVSIRHKIATGKKLEKYEQEFKKDNPTYFKFDYRTREQREEDEKIRKMWEGGN